MVDLALRRKGLGVCEEATTTGLVGGEFTERVPEILDDEEVRLIIELEMEQNQTPSTK